MKYYGGIYFQGTPKYHININVSIPHSLVFIREKINMASVHDTIKMSHEHAEEHTFFLTKQLNVALQKIHSQLVKRLGPKGR